MPPYISLVGQTKGTYTICFPHMWDPHLIIFGRRDERNISKIQNAQYDAAKKGEVKQNEQ
jgi:hypothetical protein